MWKHFSNVGTDTEIKKNIYFEYLEVSIGNKHGTLELMYDLVIVVQWMNHIFEVFEQEQFHQPNETRRTGWPKRVLWHSISYGKRVAVSKIWNLNYLLNVTQKTHI